jgi:carbamoyl-phosphate synthase small subunit
MQSSPWKTEASSRAGASVRPPSARVFNTALTGYQEVFTDPSFSGQIVILTNPEIGNCGTAKSDNEANRPYIEGLGRHDVYVCTTL